MHNYKCKICEIRLCQRFRENGPLNKMPPIGLMKSTKPSSEPYKILDAGGPHHDNIKIMHNTNLLDGAYISWFHH